MRVALVGDWPPPYGGISVHVQGLAAALRARGHEVRVLDVMPGEHRGPGVVPARGELPYARELAAVAFGGWLAHVHTTGANAKSWLVALAASRARLPGGPRGILTLHSGQMAPFTLATRRRRELARLTCAGYGHVVAVNAEVAAALRRCGVPREKLVLAPAFSPELLVRGAAPAPLHAFRREHALLYAAAVAPGPIYGADLLDAAWDRVRARLPGAGLVVFGRTSDTGVLADGAERRHVLPLGEISHPEAVAVLAESDVFVRATRSDGDAVSVREALGLGREVVASATGHRPPGCLLFPPGDAARLAAAMIDAADLPRGGEPVTAGRDPFDLLLRLYEGAWQRPVSRGARLHAQRPSSSP